MSKHQSYCKILSEDSSIISWDLKKKYAIINKQIKTLKYVQEQ